MNKILLLSANPQTLERWQADIGGTPIPHIEALARTFADAHAKRYRFDAIYADFRHVDRALVRALFQTAGFNREQVDGTVLYLDIEPGAFADQQRRFFSGLGMDCRLLGDDA
jgi:hypothetical protein